MGGRGLKLGLGGTVVVLVLSVLSGRNLFDTLGISPAGTTAEAPAGPDPERKAGEAELEKVAIGSFEDAQKVFASKISNYQDATLVLFWDGTASGCGDASANMGPFYCPLDQKVYIDLGFYDQLAKRFGAPGDFAQAYVIAHEVGHHVQHLMGTDTKMRQMQQRDPSSANALSVLLELQADCYSGVWGKTAADRHLLDPGDLEEALGAAAAVGDDKIQKQTSGRVRPDSFTHGTADQRAKWYRRGFEAGAFEACDTFAAGAM